MERSPGIWFHAEALRAKIKAFDKYVDAAAMAEYGWRRAIDEIFAACPIISVHLPATEETRHMIDKSCWKASG